ncbi:MAG TPA: MFS transporter [Vicinamibacterales bacterium]|nr:MFS transporter [Vicinamibacterales bacterium]
MPPPAPRAIPRRAVVSWVLYDLANTIFSMGVVSIYFSLYVRAEVGLDRADTVYAVITAISMGLIFVISPLLGAMTDRARRRMPFLVWSTLICCGATALFARGPFALSVLLFILANAAYQAGLQFYDALLPEVSTEQNRGRVSGIGVGIGYLGSYLAVLLGMSVPADRHSMLFGLIALAFLIFAVPCFLFVRERGNPHPRQVFGWSVVRQSTRETVDALRSGTRYPGLLRFLIGRMFYTDAINTVITYMALFTVNVAIAGGLDEIGGRAQAERVMLSAITFAVIGGLAWGRLVDRIGPRRTLNIVLAMWVSTFLLAAAIGFFRLPVIVLYAVAAMAGIALGGVWSADRPYMLRLTPPDRIGEFYGLYGMVGRFSAVSGPILWGLVMYISLQWLGLPPLTGQALAILTLLGMIVVSILILRKVTDEPRDWAALGAR